MLYKLQRKMVKTVTVVSQKRSVARPNLYITTLRDAAGELKAYCSRKLAEGEEVVISVQQGAMRDPLAVAILTDKQAEQWRNQQTYSAFVESPVEAPEVAYDSVQSLIVDALKDVSDGVDNTATTSFVVWLKDNENGLNTKDVARLIHKQARDKGFIISGGESLLFEDDKGHQIRAVISDIDDRIGKRFLVEMFQPV